MIDLSFNRSFKFKLRDLQSEWYEEQSEEIIRKQHKVSKFPKVTKQQLIQWTSLYLKEVKDNVIVYGFKKSGLGLAKDDDGVAWKRYVEEQ